MTKIIDLSILVNSGIDMEFSSCIDDVDADSSEAIWYPQQLIGVSNNATYLYSNGCDSKCRVREDHWHSWQGGANPLPDGLVIEILTRDNRQYPNHSCAGYNNIDWDWMWRDKITDIIAFKVLGVAKGYTYKWGK